MAAGCPSVWRSIWGACQRGGPFGVSVLKQQLPAHSTEHRHLPGRPRLGVALPAGPLVVTFSGPARCTSASVWGRQCW